MRKSVRSVALVVVGAFALSACGLGGLVDDQIVGGGVLGLGGGVEVTLTPPVAVAAVQTSAVTTWVGNLSKSFSLDGLGVDVPGFISPEAITETVRLGTSIDVTNPAGIADFTVTGIQLGGTFTVGTQTFNVPAGVGATGLNVLFESVGCDLEAVTCTYTTSAQNVPSFDVEFLSSQVQAYWNLLRSNGGTGSVNLIVTVTLGTPGLPEDSTVTVTLASAGATIEF
jgi:hypothetical protein